MKDDRVYLFHIRDCLERILTFTTGGKDDFFSDLKTQDAVLRNLEVIGEAAKNLSSDFKDKYADIPWRRISGLRDRLIHAYFGVNLEIVWKVVEEEIPNLKGEIDKILSA